MALRYSASATGPSLSGARDRVASPSAVSVPLASARSMSLPSAAVAAGDLRASRRRLDGLDQCMSGYARIVVCEKLS